MSLVEYKRKRSFDKTTEPSGRAAKNGGNSFVVQKHDASHLHYDFRLELDGVLKSWAVPKGPSLNPADKRLAVHVEDHPVDYGSFEGTIPAGEYGGGTVMLWDRGTWVPEGDPHKGYRQGKLKFTLHGEKLRGGWVLVRSGSRGKDNGRNWLLFKQSDDEAWQDRQKDILKEMPQSVSTGRGMEEIASGKKPRNQSAKNPTKAAAKKPARRTAKRQTAKGTRSRTAPASTRVAKLPTRIDVQLARLVKSAPEGDDWLHEIKLDGYRMVCRIDGEQVKFISRNHLDWTRRVPTLAEDARHLNVDRALLDGEVVVMDADGKTDFQALQNSMRDARSSGLRYFVFDLLHWNGHDLRGLPLEERKRMLEEILSQPGTPASIQISEHVVGGGAAFLEHAHALGLEGIISKRKEQPYEPGRGDNWVKVKCLQVDEFVIGGFTKPQGTRTGFGALLVGYYDAAGKLKYAGKVGTGYDERSLAMLSKQFKSHARETSPFQPAPRVSGNSVHWLEPKLIAQVAYGSWTRDGILRHSAFQGLREDKAAKEIVRDRAISLPVPAAQSTTKKTTVNAAKTRFGGKKPRRATASSSARDSIQEEFHGVRLTSPDKLLYPEDGITKLDLANYYRDIADWILPYIAGRPLVLVRCPDGGNKACFYQKHPGAGTPDTLRQISIREKTKVEQYLMVDDVAGLISLAQISALEIHGWGSREDKLEQPDQLIFDLDPDADVPWPRVVESAKQMRRFLQELGLESFLKTTGGKGLHLVVPIARRHDWDTVKEFCKHVAQLVVTADPANYTANMSKAARPGKIFIDYLRNARGATAIVPFSPRSRPGATVSVPLAWEELTTRVRSDRYTIANLARRLQSLKDDPWSGMAQLNQSLTGPMKHVSKLLS